MKKFTGILISIIIAIVVALGNCWISTFLVDLIKGNNYSDVGVPMYSNSTAAIITGLLAYFIIGLACLLAGIKFLKIKSFRQIYIIINIIILIPWLFIISISLNL